MKRTTKEMDSDTASASRSDDDAGSSCSSDTYGSMNENIGVSYDGEISHRSDYHLSKWKKRRHRSGKQKSGKHQRHWNTGYGGDETIHVATTDDSEPDMVFDEARHVVQTEMGCGWVMLPLLELYTSSTNDSRR